MNESSPAQALTTRTLVPQPIDTEAFAPFGDYIAPSAYGAPFGADDAKLELTRGTPRIYIMRAPDHGMRFHRITRHDRVTQCLSSARGETWYLVVAPPPASDAVTPLDPDTIRAFSVSGSAMVKLHAGTWHAGPYFRAPHMDFINLERADTNQNDHNAIDLRETWGIEFVLAPSETEGTRS